MADRPRMLRAAALLLTVAVGLVVVEACRSKEPATLQDLMVDAKGVFAESLRDAIADPERAERALAIFQLYDDRESLFLERAIDVRRRLFELNSDYHASTADFEALLAELRAERRELAQEMLDDFAELKGQVTRDEWGAVFGAMQDLDESWEALLR